MKKFFFVGFLWVLSFSAFAQSDLTSVSISKNNYGKDILNGEDIVGKEYIFSQRVEQFDILSNDRMLIQLRAKRKYSEGLKNKGRAFLYNLKNLSVKWERKMHYKVSWIESYGDLLLYQNNAMGSSRLDLETGENAWTNKYPISSIDENGNIGFTFKNFGNKETIVGVRLKDGEKIWKRKIKRDKDWQEGIWIDDSRVLLVTSGLHMINVKTGIGWDYECETTSSDYSAVIGTAAFGVLLGATTGVYLVPVSGPDIVTGLHSNVLFLEDYLYFASRDKLAKIEKSTGKVVWSVLLDKKKSSQSIIFTQANTLYMVNQAFVQLGDGKHYGGKPFFAAFDINTGEKKFETNIKGKDIFIADYLVGKEDILFLFQDKIARYSLSTGSLIEEREIVLEKGEKMEFFIDDDYFIESSYGITSIPDLNPENLYVSTRDDKIFSIRNDLTKGDTIDRQKVYITNFIQPGFKFINKGSITILLDSKDKIIARLDVPQEAALYGNKLFFRKENKVVEINLEVFFDNLD